MSFTFTHSLVTLASDNFENLVQFYKRFLCLEPVIYRAEVYAEFHLPGLRLGVFHPSKKSPSHPIQSPQTRGMAICLEVENLEAAIAHLAELGFPPAGEIVTASHGREIDAYDPDNNWLILHEANQPSTGSK